MSVEDVEMGYWIKAVLWQARWVENREMDVGEGEGGEEATGRDGEGDEIADLQLGD